jgi:hypothetical protein
MYALRERRQHVTQEDFEFAVAKVFVVIGFLQRCADVGSFLGAEKEPRGQYIGQQALLIDCRILWLIVFYALISIFSPSLGSVESGCGWILVRSC